MIRHEAPNGENAKKKLIHNASKKFFRPTSVNLSISIPLPPILQGKFTCKTDVWAFGVTLWEILTLAKEQPFAHLADEGVVENLRQVYAGSGLQIYLPQPLNCPREVYDLMLQCWARDDVQRPAFKEIHMFLTMKNKGYIPPVE